MANTSKLTASAAYMTSQKVVTRSSSVVFGTVAILAGTRALPVESEQVGRVRAQFRPES